MKSSHLITICLLLNVLIQIECQIQNVMCGQLAVKNLLPLLANSFSLNHHWPWHAAIYHQLGNPNPSYQCGGTLIDTKSVLTAAHCVYSRYSQLNVTLITVSLGRLDLAKNESSAQSFEVSEVFVHPDYNTDDYANDIAIIRLSADAIFNDYVQPICLWKSHKTDISEVVGKMGTVVGWGLTENGTTSGVLQQANFPVEDFFTCVKSNPPFFGRILTETNFCAGYRNGTGLCQGDSGGSITFEQDGSYYIRGIVSVGQAKPNRITKKFECDTSQYTVFTDVAKYLPWIADKTTEAIFSRASYLSINSKLPTVVDVETDFSVCGKLSFGPMPLMINSYETHRWPWHAALYLTSNSTPYPVYICGGTVISSKSILTAGHCVQVDPYNITVHLGRLNLGVDENSAQTIGVSNVIVHPEFEMNTYKNDIAIIKLATDAIFNSNVRPVCLWKSSNTELSEVVGKLGTVVGWGITETGTLSHVLQEATFPVVSHVTCVRSNPDLFGRHLFESNFCAGHLNGTVACFGDDGGSMTFEEDWIYYIRGIMSAGPSKYDQRTGYETCDSMQYSVFTDVSKYLTWIKDNQ